MFRLESRELKVSQKRNIIDLTETVNEVILRYGVREGKVLIQSLHTTCGLVLQENEECLLQDFQNFLKRFCPEDGNFLHDDFSKRKDFCSPKERKNCAAHLRCFFLPSSLVLAIKEGKVLLGKFQTILFLDLDPKGRKKRTVVIQVEGE